MNVWELLIAGIPGTLVSAIVGIIVGRIDKRQRKREQGRKQFELYQIQMMAASAALGKANAIALRNGKCNGETHAALEALERVKEQQRDFLFEHGVDDLF